jgi:hypothetical protein
LKDELLCLDFGEEVEIQNTHESYDFKGKSETFSAIAIGERGPTLAPLYCDIRIDKKAKPSLQSFVDQFKSLNIE